MTLLDLKIGASARIVHVWGQGALRQHFLDMGVIPGAVVRLLKYAPMGDPMELLLHGYTLTLRKADAARIDIEPLPVVSAEQKGAFALSGDACRTVPGLTCSEACSCADCACRTCAGRTASEATPEAENIPYIASLHEHNSHPGYGEEGKFHDKAEERSLPKGTLLTFALVGNQNSGKTTLFNQLTGSNQHVGNFPGVTVDRKEGVIKGQPDTLVTDLPGIYSLSPYTAEEIISRRVILEEKPKGIINIVDASNIERNLYLTIQLMELEIPMVLALNMMDEIRHNGGSIRVNEMERLLGIPVVPISAARNEGVEELVAHAVHVARHQEVNARPDFCGKDDAGGAVHRCLHSIRHLIEDHAVRAGIPVRFAASKLVERDAAMLEQLKLDSNEREMLEHILVQLEDERGLDCAAAMADMRFSFIRRLSAQTVIKPHESREYLRSKHMDRVLTGRWTAIPIFLAVMCAVIWLSIDVLGTPLQNAFLQTINGLSDFCADRMAAFDVSPTVRSLVTDALFGGVGSVLSFVPLIVLLFLFLSLIEDSGYMARIAFVTDKLLRKIGLSGRSIVPLLIGFGCSVPAIMATRTLPSARDRLKTILLTPFMSCSAKMPVFAFFSAAFFPEHAGLVVVSLYLMGILVGVLGALAAKYIFRRGEAAPFVMELPNYRMPRMQNVAHLLWDKTKDFVHRAFTVIFTATIVIWFLQSFNFRFDLVEESGRSMLAWLSGLLEPVFEPIGLGDWRIVTAFVCGFMAKESVVSTLGMLHVTEVLTTLTSVPIMIFTLLYSPCVAAVAAIRRELGRWWALFVVLFQCLLAWLCAGAGYFLAQLLLQA